MKFLTLCCVVLVALTCVTSARSQTIEGASTAPAAPSKYHRATGRVVPDSYMVVFNKQVRDAEVSGLADSLAAKFGGVCDAKYDRVLHGFAVHLSEPIARLLSEDPRVAYVEEDSYGEALSTVQTVGYWGLDRIDQASLPLNGTYVYDYDGTGVDIYVIDSGIQGTHQQFMVGSTSRVSFLNDYTGEGAVPGFDYLGHGTEVAGIAAGKDDGVAKNAKIYNLRVVKSDNTSRKSWFVSAVNDAVLHHDNQVPHRPGVVNVSLIYDLSSTIDEAVRSAIVDHGLVFSIAAGNYPPPPTVTNNGQNSTNYSPQRVTAALTVAATGNYVAGNTNQNTAVSDARASFSMYGKVVDIFAPGVLIHGPHADTTHPSSPANNLYSFSSGTSDSAPYVAGLAALYLQANPGASVKTVRAAIRNGAKLVVTNPGANTTTRFIYTRFPFSPTQSLTFTDEQQVCSQEGGVWDSASCGCLLPIDVDPNPCPLCQ